MITLKHQTVEVDEPPFEDVGVQYDYELPQRTHLFVFNRRLPRPQEDGAIGLTLGVRVAEQLFYLYPDAAYRLALALIHESGGFDAVAERRQAGQMCKIITLDSISMEW